MTIFSNDIVLFSSCDVCADSDSFDSYLKVRVQPYLVKKVSF